MGLNGVSNAFVFLPLFVFLAIILSPSWMMFTSSVKAASTQYRSSEATLLNYQTFPHIDCWDLNMFDYFVDIFVDYPIVNISPFDMRHH